jgi:hypothetical protein
MQVRINETRKTIDVINIKKRQKPILSDVLKAIIHRVTISNMVNTFSVMGMPVVAKHLEAAYKEIDRIWEDGDFQS